LSVQLALALGADIKEELPNETDEPAEPAAVEKDKTPVDGEIQKTKKKMKKASKLSRRVSCLHYIGFTIFRS